MKPLFKDLAAMALRVRRSGPRDLILCYHGIEDGPELDGTFVDPKKRLPLATFRRQLDWLAWRGRFVSLSDILTPRAPGDGWRFAITFDDGYRNNIDAALPALETAQAPMTWFVASAFVEDHSRLPWWDLLHHLERHLDAPLTIEIGPDLHRLGTTPATPGASAAFKRLRAAFLDHPGDTRPLEAAVIAAATAQGVRLPHNGFASAETVRRAAIHPLVEIGAHTHDHVNMAQTSASDSATELATNIARLNDWTGQTPRHFAYPYGTTGAVSASAAEQVRSAGLEAAVTTRRAYLDPNPDPFQIPRLTVQTGWSDAVFRSRVVALERWERLR